ncbi:hypothetical protein Leryth_023446 [Lithospermum erythrorhizon]|nr:hypothetical protein Leryth_023446 [Lithospermum erythrorhizon]
MAEKRKDLMQSLEEAVPIKEPMELYKSMRYTILNFEMFGPLMSIAACELVGGKQEKVMPAACAIQMVLSMAMIHDDLPCIDDTDDIRDGKPANHNIYGASVALLAGDALGVLAFQHMANATKDVGPERVLRAISELGAGVGPQLQAGQVVDVLSRGGGYSLEQLEFINFHKTGGVYGACMAVGGIIGGGEDYEIEILRFYGQKVGLMLQLVDDLRDMDEDSKNDQVTYPLLVGVECSSE